MVSAGPLVIKSFTPTDFTSSDRGYTDMKDISLTLAELSAALGVNTDDLLANDQFRIDGRVITSDGKEFTFDNSSAAINGSAFQGHFRFTLKVTCPLTDDLFTGSYKLSYDELGGDWAESLVEGDVTLRTVAGSTTKREFDATYLAGLGGFDAPGIQMDFVCTEVVMLDYDPGLSCGTPAIFLFADAAQPVDISDPNADIVLWYTEDTGACAAGTPLQKMRLTRN